MIGWLWKTLAWVISSRPIASWLIGCAQRTPYSNITSADGLDTYMRRWWLFNPYDRENNNLRRFSWFPISVRVHHILRPDQDRHLHDHPWNARTIVLAGWYCDERENGVTYPRGVGDTARLRFGEFHRISEVSEGGVFTLFITGRYQGGWGFKIPYREYLDARR